MKKIFLITLSLMITMVSCSQKKKSSQKNKIIPGHKIEFNIAGMANEKLMLAYHYSGKHYISDTIMLDENGYGVLQDSLNSKEKGVYLAVLPSLNNKYFEFLISEQYFTVSTSKDGLQKNEIDFTNSPENDLFMSDMMEMNNLRKNTEKLRNQAKTADDATKEKLNAEIEKINKTYLDKRKQYAVDFPDYFYIDLLGLMREIEIPEPPKDENGEFIDSSFGWKYYKNHYWDYTDFSESGILRTPIYFKKVDEFISKRTESFQDSIIASCDVLLDKAKVNDDVFQFTLVTLVNKYANSKIMGDDAVYVHLVKSYYEKGLAPWTDSTSLASMVERATALEPLLIGKPSPNLSLRDTTLKTKYRLHDLPSDYTIVFVWDPECGHCKKSTPVINDFFKKYGRSKNILVYSISTVNYQEIDEWKEYVRDNDLNWINVADPYNETKFRSIYDISSTPQIYVLDKNKEIIAKRIGAKQLEQFFYNYFKNYDKEKFKGMEGLKFDGDNKPEEH